MTSSRVLILICFVLLMAGCATAPRSKAGDVLGPEDLKKLCDRYNIRWDVDYGTQVVTLNRDNAKAQALVGSPVVMVKGKVIHLNAPVTRQQNAVIVPADFKNKVIDVLIKEISHSIQKFRKVVVDAGHGGKDPGAIGLNGTNEKDVVLDIARRLEKRLKAIGMQVVMTRDKDEFISLQERTEIASRANADLFISVHANSSPARSAKGMEVYYLRNLDPKEKNDPQIGVNQQLLFRNFAMQKDSSQLAGIIGDMLYDYKQEESKQLAGYVVNKAARAIHASERGSKTAGFFVLRNTLIPTILVEVGFLTNRQEGDLLSRGHYRQEIADALAETIFRYARSTK